MTRLMESRDVLLSGLVEPEIGCNPLPSKGGVSEGEMTKAR